MRDPYDFGFRVLSDSELALHLATRRGTFRRDALTEASRIAVLARGRRHEEDTKAEMRSRFACGVIAGSLGEPTYVVVHGTIRIAYAHTLAEARSIANRINFINTPYRFKYLWWLACGIAAISTVKFRELVRRDPSREITPANLQSATIALHRAARMLYLDVASDGRIVLTAAMEDAAGEIRANGMHDGWAEILDAVEQNAREMALIGATEEARDRARLSASVICVTLSALRSL